MQSASAHPELARVRLELPVDKAKQRCLAGAAGSGYLDQLTESDREVDVLEDGFLAECLRDPNEPDLRFARELAVGRRAVSGRPVFLRLLALDVGGVFGRASAARCRWSASHPWGPD